MTKHHGHKSHAPVAPASTDAEADAPAGQAETGTAEAQQADTAAAPEPDPDRGVTNSTQDDPGALGKVAGANGVQEISEAEREKLRAEWAQREEDARLAMEQLRADTPVQVVKIRPEPKGKLLGMVVRGQDGKVRTARLEDWRTEQVELKAGDHVFILVLAGEDLTHFESFEAREREQNAPPPAAAADPAPAVEG